MMDIEKNQHRYKLKLMTVQYTVLCMPNRMGDKVHVPLRDVRLGPLFPPQPC